MTVQNSQVAENTAKIVPTLLLTDNIHVAQDGSAMKKPPKQKVMTKIALVPNAVEMEIVDAARRKYGLKAAAEVLRMALTRFAEAEGLKAS